MLNKLVDFLKAEYSPTSIILHGSRANGFAQDHSDWDFLLIGVPNVSTRLLLLNENVEVKGLSDPVSDLELKDNLEKFQFAKVVFDTKGIGLNTLERSENLLKEGFVWPETWPAGPILYLQSRLDGLIDTQARPEIFMRHLAIFYQRALNYWFLLRRRFPLPIYLALKEMEHHDPEYVAQISILASQVSNKEKIVAAQRIIELLKLVT